MKVVIFAVLISVLLNDHKNTPFRNNKEVTIEGPIKSIFISKNVLNALNFKNI